MGLLFKSNVLRVLRVLRGKRLFEYRPPTAVLAPRFPPLCIQLKGLINLCYSEERMPDEAQLVSTGARRNEDIALDLMKFIAMTTGYGKTGSPGTGFQGGTAPKAEDYAGHLLELYIRCLHAVAGK